MQNGMNYTPNPGVQTPPPPAYTAQPVQGQPPVPPTGNAVPPVYTVPPVQGQVPVYPAAPVPPYVVPQPPRRQYTMSQKVFALLMFVFGYLFMRVFRFEDGQVGRTVFTLLLLIVSAVYMSNSGVKPGAVAVLSGLAAGVLSLGYAFGLPVGMSFPLTVVCILFYAYFVYKAYDTGIERGPGRFFDVELIRALFVAPFSSWFSVFPAAFSTKGEKNQKISKKLGLILLGLVFSIVPTLIVVAFLSYDKNFTDLLDRVLAIDVLKGDVWSHFSALLLGVPVAMTVYGLWTSGTFKVCRQLTAQHCAERRTRARIMPQIVALATITPVLFIYLLFFISQFGYFTSAFTGVLPKGYSYAEYARSGFFQLCAVMVLNGILAYLLFLLVRQTGKNGIARLYTALLSLSTVILAVTAASKTFLYADFYGLTLRRVSALCFIVAMGLVFLMLFLQSIVPKFPFVPVSVLILTLLFGGLMLSNAPAWVSGYNTAHILAGADWELDEEYFEQMGPAAIPDAIKLAYSDAETVSVKTKNAARDAMYEFEKEMNEDPPRISEYSLNYLRAARASRQREASLQNGG